MKTYRTWAAKAGMFFVGAMLVLSSAGGAAAQTKTVHIGACVGVTGTSLIQSVSYGYGRTAFPDADCAAGYLWGYALGPEETDYFCQVGWDYSNPALCSYFDNIISMAHSHNVCDDITGLCYGYFGTSDS